MSPPKIPKIQRQKKKLPDPENWMNPPQKKKKKPKPNPKEIKTKAQRKLNLG